jgi:stage II sporulation SpoAA-like protein
MPGLRLEEGIRVGANGVIEYHCAAVVSAPEIKILLEVLRRRTGQERRILADARDLESVDASARKVIYANAAKTRDVRVAVVGNNWMQRMIVQFLAVATANMRTRFFHDFQEAERWLLS